MDTQKWRHRANIVASVDAVFVALDCFGIVVLTAMTFLWGPVDLIKFYKLIPDEYTNVENLEKRLDESKLQRITVHIRISLGFGALYCLIEAMAVGLLMKACKPSCEINVAARNARTWRNIKILFIVFFMKRIFDMTSTELNVVEQFFVGKVIGNLVGLAIVQMYINEIDEILTIRRNANPNCDLTGVNVQNDFVNPVGSNLNTMNTSNVGRMHHQPSNVSCVDV